MRPGGDVIVRVVTSVFVCAGSCADPFSCTTPSTVRVWAGVRAGGDASVWVVMRVCGCLQRARRDAAMGRLVGRASLC